MARAVPFTHLHTHSHYSLLTALPKIDELVAAAKADGQKSLALTDAGSLYGAIEFYKTCKKNEIKPILGVDAYLAPRTRHDKEHRIDNHTSRLVLLAQNETGYRNLLKLVSASFLEGFYYNPRADRELLEKYCDGLIAIIPSFAGEPVQYLKNADEKRASESLSWHKEVFKDRLFAEITAHPEIEGFQERMRATAELMKKMDVPLVAAHDVYYLRQDDALARELVVKIKLGGRLDRDLGVGNEHFAFITQDEAGQRLAEFPDALERTQIIADMCDLDLKLGSWVFPNFPIPENSSHEKELRALSLSGFAMRSLQQTPVLLERLDHELGIISKKGYSPYFLVVADLLRHAREVGIYTNTRGSAAGSLVSYLCGITTVDPVHYGLPFERFLNPERPSPPDIDMDLADNRRDDMIEYARKKYGDDRVVQIGTFGTMMARAAVRDVARALGYSYGTGDQIAKLIPFGKQGFPMTIDKALEEVPELLTAYKNDSETSEILDLAKKIEGNARHVGVHAAGVVIAPGPITDFVPVQFDPKGGKMITQYDMHAVEDAGLLKFDFLGLKNLSVLADSVDRVQKRQGTSIDIDTLPLDSAKTYQMLSRGETLGVFQLSGQGMTAYLKDLVPTVIYDLNAMVALYRPGPMAFIPDYIQRKKNPSLVTYLDPRMERILDKSYGVITYQDDVLEIAIQLAGYTWGEADKFRKAMGKKIPEEMAAQKGRFLSGCVERGMNAAKAQQLWEQIETFAAYGFNKAHAVSYGNLAYKTAYMKANFPVDYMAALLTADAGDVEEIGRIVAECRRMGIAVLPPDVQESFGDFTVANENTIRFGLYSIKNFGRGVADAIIGTRTRDGAFKDMGDFLSRVTDKNLNKKSLESLVMAGALDSLGERGRILAHIDLLLTFHKEAIEINTDQHSLFGVQATPTFILPDAKPAPQHTMLAWEKELLGLYISGHPLDLHREKLARQKFDISKTKEKVPKDVLTVISGIVEERQDIVTKGGDKMSFLTFADYAGSIEVVCFPRVLKEFGALLIPGTCLLIKGRLSPRNGEDSFVAEAVKKM